MFNIQTIIYKLLALISTAYGDDAYAEIQNDVETWFKEHKARLAEIATAKLNGADNNFILAALRNEVKILENEALALAITGKVILQDLMNSLVSKFNELVGQSGIVAPIDNPTQTDVTTGTDEGKSDEGTASTDVKNEDGTKDTGSTENTDLSGKSEENQKPSDPNNSTDNAENINAKSDEGKEKVSTDKTKSAVNETVDTGKTKVDAKDKKADKKS